MKKIIVLSIAALLSVAVLVFAADDGKSGLRPAQKLMQVRAAWMTVISKNLGDNKFEAVTKDASELAAEAKKTGENISNPLGKEITLAISSLATELSAAAGRQDGESARVKLGEIKAQCGKCHNQIRDKK